MKTCKNVKRYRGILKPRCDRGCNACLEKYRTGPLRLRQKVVDRWYSYPSIPLCQPWGEGTVIRVLKTRYYIKFGDGQVRRFDRAHAKRFLRKVI